MVGHLTIKHLRDISDKRVLEQWQENVYYQYFCGEQELCVRTPCSATEFVEFCKRTGMEPVIGNLKSDHRLGRNFYKGVFGDEVNTMYAAAYNFKRTIMLLLDFIFEWIIQICGGMHTSRWNIVPRIEPLPCPVAPPAYTQQSARRTF